MEPPKPPVDTSRLAQALEYLDSLSGATPKTVGSGAILPLTLNERMGEFGFDPSLKRGSLLPFGTNQQGENEWAVPEIGYGMMKAWILPGHVAQGGTVTNNDVMDAALNIAGMGGFGSMGLGAKAVGGQGGKVLGANVVSDAERVALPTDTAIRMARAEGNAALPTDFDNRRYRATADMGFEFDKPVYHLTSKDVGAFQLGADPSSHTGGGAIWLRRNPRSNPAAHQVSSPREVYREGANDMPLVMRRDGELPDNVVAELISKGKLSNDFPLRVSIAENKMLRGLGYKFYEKGNEIAVFDTSHIRSPHAQFDPAKKDSADLLAMTGNPAMLAAGQNQDTPGPSRMALELAKRLSDADFYAKGGI